MNPRRQYFLKRLSKAKGKKALGSFCAMLSMQYSIGFKEEHDKNSNWYLIYV